ncbi:C39 family peptidase [Oscillatoria sp. CS-180]|uniref:C39 family peptidase n=1 Tax=Oscillatoria sp. CS-180 TaxID=3021720 RepID=UPI00232D6315|nr:C39 family peptidase [Oscillatoria sp. CS-180]MDB9525594.1 C39 family peptidase [Oscillatoria sp. CS-180]
MPKASALGNTFLKSQPIASQDLRNNEKIYVPKGHEFYITRWAPHRNQHVFMELASPLTTRDGVTRIQKVYGYDPHIKIEGEPDKSTGGGTRVGKLDTTKLIKLNVPYFQQMNNDPTIARIGAGWRQCNTTSNCMLADYLLQGKLSQAAKQKGYPEPESVYMRIVAKYGDTVDHNAQTAALKEIGIDSYFSRSLSSQDVMLSLSYGIPVVVGFAYKVSGHICIIVGHDPVRRVYLVHDPYGIRYGSSDSYDVNAWAAFDPYSYGTMQRIYWDMGGEAGWGRIVTRVNGQPTGLPTKL